MSCCCLLLAAAVERHSILVSYFISGKWVVAVEKKVFVFWKKKKKYFHKNLVSIVILLCTLQLVCSVKHKYNTNAQIPYFVLNIRFCYLCVEQQQFECSKEIASDILFYFFKCRYKADRIKRDSKVSRCAPMWCFSSSVYTFYSIFLYLLPSFFFFSVSAAYSIRRSAQWKI